MTVGHTDAFTVACVQMTSARDIQPNIETIDPLVRQARERGADLVLLPENASMLEPDNALLRQKACAENDHPALAAFRALAAETGVWLLIGSLAIRADRERVANRCFLVDPAGEIVARYDKIHLFDVDLGAGESYRESEYVRPGDRAVVVPLPWGNLGLSICYDIRFPQLYRSLAKRGADFIAVPAAFTRTTGEVHWHVLLRARAIETGCYVLAPAQCGEHAEGRETFGHSLVVDPWGAVVADGGTATGLVLADIAPSRVREARSKIPALSHDRPFD